MDKELLRIAGRAIKRVYDGECQDMGSTECALTLEIYRGNPIQVLAIGGSNEGIDWFWNALMVSWDGVKYCSYLSAQRIARRFSRDKTMPLLVTGHSKSGPTALYWKKRYGADSCISFCPARGFRKPIPLDNTIIVIDPDDPVPKLGALNFRHPICEKIILPDDHKGLSVGDHFIDHIINYFEKEEGNECIEVA
ncbi:hypothetical protein [Desulfospira joergensenii]|uniref:hypothetical protein n=1 Tax=Desulfospira joergensenii TaxID=53329 RepID=UPI0003B47349|nr:hypothetical protein [Desulfospira joergensenii]